MTAVEVVGWLGAALLLAAYALISRGRLAGDGRIFQWLNIAGSGGLALSSTVHGAWPSAALNASVDSNRFRGIDHRGVDRRRPLMLLPKLEFRASLRPVHGTAWPPPPPVTRAAHHCSPSLSSPHRPTDEP
ncbi:CBU_0592 family membrane protein [Micromonospora sp. MS34]|uniref:CBU_0592 family membrane protein n=1 Tax=Micromonospora sp. MS34 TaxID=3385971 RepID=UPI0039A3B374